MSDRLVSLIYTASQRYRERLCLSIVIYYRERGRGERGRGEREEEGRGERGRKWIQVVHVYIVMCLMVSYSHNGTYTN